MIRIAAVAFVLLLSGLAVAPLPTRAEIPSASVQPVSAAVEAARVKIAGGDLAGAIAGLEAYVPAHGEDVPAARLLGDLYFRLPEYKKAEAVWKALVARNPGDKETHNRLGSLYAALDRIPESIAEFEKSLPNRGGFYGLVEQHRRNGDLGAFQAQFAQLAELHPLDPNAQSFYANILRAQNQFDAAQPYFARVVVLTGANCGALVDLGNNEIDLNRLDDAIGHLKKCLKIEPANYAALVDIGEAYIERNDNATARACFERALAAKPDGSEALVDIGYLLDVDGRWREAVGLYARAMTADPLQAVAYINIGYDYNEHQLYQLAEAAFLKGISVSPEDGRLHYMLAVTYNVQGKVELAREQYRVAISSQEPIVVRAAQAELALLPGGG